MCQTCVDEGRLSQETFDKIEAFCDRWDSAEFGPAHILLSDCNVLDSNILFCLKQTELVKQEDERWVGSPWYQSQEPGELEATVAFLNDLLQIPEDIR